MYFCEFYDDAIYEFYTTDYQCRLRITLKDGRIINKRISEEYFISAYEAHYNY